MTSTSMSTILRAQSLLMREHDVTSETALGLLVWESDRRSVPVVDVASGVCAAIAGPADADGLLGATA